jgi:hypothetical protein
MLHGITTGRKEQVNRIRVRVRLAGSWTLLPKLDVNDDGTEWRYQLFALPLVVTLSRSPLSGCPMCSLPSSTPVFETYACPHPDHPLTREAA